MRERGERGREVSERGTRERMLKMALPVGCGTCLPPRNCFSLWPDGAWLLMTGAVMRAAFGLIAKGNKGGTFPLVLPFPDGCEGTGRRRGMGSGRGGGRREREGEGRRRDAAGGGEGESAGRRVVPGGGEEREGGAGRRREGRRRGEGNSARAEGEGEGEGKGGEVEKEGEGGGGG